MLEAASLSVSCGLRLGRPLMIFYATTIFLSALLLFLVQPIIAKQLLPWFGGSASVWTTCMVFFQSLLLAGYAYSDWLARKASGWQARIHTVLGCASLAMLPIVPSLAWRPTDGDHPIGRILLLLTATVGLPFFVLSTTGPLVQAWFARAYPHARVYRLYALSNIGSVLALAAYPIAIEPMLNVRSQALVWSGAYATFVVFVIVCAWLAASRPAVQPLVRGEQSGVSAPPSGRQQLLWCALSALGSTLLLTVTAHVQQNIASVPFLWILPLAIYLLTFILCFDGQGWYRPRLFRVAALVCAPLLIAGLTYRLSDTGMPQRGLMSVWHALPLYMVGLFVLCMFCHGELAARKPPARHLTRYFLMVSLGGAAGGVVVGIIVPLVLHAMFELPLAIALLVLLAAMMHAQWMRKVALVSFVICAVAAWQFVRATWNDALLLHRDFYGALRIVALGSKDDGNLTWQLMHGTIVHGAQIKVAPWSQAPTTYYGERSGVGRAIDIMRQVRSGPQRIGLVGMGTGTLAAYGRAGDVYRFYELSPAVLQIANSHFSYLKDSAASIETVLGDARLSLEAEPAQRFDVLAVDAFSSDSIPVHLLTQEAMQLYARHVREDGVVAFHISNRYLKLAPIVKQLADSVGMHAVYMPNVPDPKTPEHPSEWVLVTPNRELADTFLGWKLGNQIAAVPGLRPWTDDYNNLLQVMR